MTTTTSASASTSANGDYQAGNNSHNIRDDSITQSTGSAEIPPTPTSPQSRKAELLSRPPPPSIPLLSSVTSPTSSTSGTGSSKSLQHGSTSAATTANSSNSIGRRPNVLPGSTAVELYAAAVLAEREGRLNDALRAYRSAFRKDEHVDKAYHRLQTAQREKELNGSKNKHGGSSDLNDADADAQVNDLVFTYQRTLQLEPDYERERQLKGRMFTSNYVQRLIQSFLENPYLSENAKLEQQNKQKTFPPGGDGTGKKKEEKKIQSIEEALAFTPQKESKPIYIARLPDEILLHIASFICELSPNARYPDMRSLERGYALSCRKLRILTLGSQSLWRDVCIDVYRHPQILEEKKSEVIRKEGEGEVEDKTPNSAASYRQSACMRQAVTKYSLDWRLMWIEQPRIRTDGVYISQITYLRRGASDASYYDPTHVITYYRYLVFLPSGDVVSLLSHDIPKEVVPTLLSSTHGTGNHRMQKPGYTVGKWRLIHLPNNTSTGSNASATIEDGAETKGKDASATIVQCTSLEDPRITDVAEIKYSFKLICRLKSTTRGKMNKLEMLQLLALNHRTGEEAPIPVKQVNGNMPSFYFSRVLSYD